MTSPVKLQIRFTTQNRAYSYVGLSTKVVQRIVKFQLFDFCHFCFCFFLTCNWDPMGVKVSNDISSASIHQISAKKKKKKKTLMQTPGEGLYQSC